LRENVIDIFNNEKLFSLFTLFMKFVKNRKKQLLIILGEGLLQSAAPLIYIADEPELSVHVDWQEDLVDSIKSVHPMSQIIFATHSPDIVSHYGKSVINMEKYVS